MGRQRFGFDPNAGMNATIKRCMDDEQQAKDQLDTQWLEFVNSNRVTCNSEAVGNDTEADRQATLIC
jgi:hypothetical protein